MKAGWVTVPLGEIAELRGRIGWKGLTAKEYTETGPLFLSVHSLNYGDYVDFRDAFHITQERYDESPEIMLQRDDILICKDGAGIGKLGIVREVDEPTTINSSLLLIRPNARVVPKYLYYCLLSPYFQQIVQSRLEGATTPHLYQRDIVTFPVFLPPLEEQQRIVAVLNEAFEGLTHARAHAEANLQNARELFTSAADRLLAENSKGWNTGTLSDLIGPVATGPFGSILHKSDYVENCIPIINPANIVDGRIVADLRKTIRKDKVKLLSSYVLRRGDIVIGRRGEMGRCAVVEEEQDGWLCGTGSFFIRPTQNIVPAFVAHVLRSPSYVAMLEAASSGATMANLSNKVVAGLVISLPQLSVQADYLSKINDLQQATDDLAKQYSAKLHSFDALRQSVLQKAFAGELT